MNTFAPSQIAVLDWLDGGLVHAQGGQRDKYRPLAATFPACDGQSPLALVRELQQRLGVTQFYLADLDSLRGRPETGAHELALAILDQGFTLWWDRGYTESPARMCRSRVLFEEFGPRYRPVLGTESCRSPGELFERLAGSESGPWTLSLDLFSRGDDWLWFGHQATASGILELAVTIADANRLHKMSADISPRPLESWAEVPFAEILDRIARSSVQEVIVLNLADVGSTSSTTGFILQSIRTLVPNIRLVAGGGVRDIAGIQQLLNHGAHRVLVGTWLWSQLSWDTAR